MNHYHRPGQVTVPSSPQPTQRHIFSSIVSFAERMLLQLTILALSLDVVRLNVIPQQENCECWDGYKAESNKNGSQCVGVNLFHIMPCNMAKTPKCQCSGRVSSILKDRTGTWCTRYSHGVELARWPCENTEEWEAFFEKYPDFI